MKVSTNAVAWEARVQDETNVIKYLPLKDIDTVNNAINFSTSDLHIIGSCDVYTTKAAGSDKKLYRFIENTLESRYESLVRLSASFSPPSSFTQNNSKNTPQEHGERRSKRSRTAETPEIDLSRDSPFGSLSKMSARRTFAYLIATLNAAHPDYDFSNVLRPRDFKKERSLRTLINTIDTTLCNLRPKQNIAAQLLAVPNSHSSLVAATNDVWSPRMWSLIDQEMDLQHCERYSYAPEDDPLDGEEGAIWSMHYFFFNKERKRVCYFYLRGLSVISHSPVASQIVIKRKSSNISRSESAGKRASYWLGDKASDGVEYDDADESMQDVYYESSDDEDVDRARYTDLDRIRNNISAGYWGLDGTDERAVGPGSVTDEIGESMEL